ncbi:unnamed protein product [Closterium sp. NIES-64]|nr:unnamed protein product [Closterium sp. NIES-64]
MPGLPHEHQHLSRLQHRDAATNSGCDTATPQSDTKTADRDGRLERVAPGAQVHLDAIGASAAVGAST